jgi:serine/threonine-protein kinase
LNALLIEVGLSELDVNNCTAAVVRFADKFTESTTQRLRTSCRRLSGAEVGCLLVGAVAAGLAAWALTPAPAQPVFHLAVPLPVGERLPVLNTPHLALSPDGSRIAFVSASEGGRQLYVRAFDNPESNAIPGTEGAESPFFSPDGQWLGFAAGGNLMKV